MKDADQGHVAYVDGLRALAVLAVVVCHSGAATFGVAAGWRVCGARGVDLFFVISGFCLAHPSLSRRRSGSGEGTVAFGPFLRRRLARLGPSYYGAIALFAILGMTGFGLPTAPMFHHAGLRGQMHEIVADALFMPSPQSLYNATFWTLGLELQWYLVFPALLALYVRQRLLFALAGVTFYVLYLATHVAPPIAGVLPCFMCGIVAADFRLSGKRLPTATLAFVALLLVLAIHAQLQQPADVDHGDPLWHGVAFGIVLLAGSCSVAFTRMLSARPLTFIGERSYSIYLVHAPFLAFLGHAGIPWALAAVCAVGVGFLYWQIVERRFMQPGTRFYFEELPARLDKVIFRLQRAPEKAF
ncbi:MAG: acyltransferase [Candidatus Eremiobacteraeota bacterium]|nr:acyltransferase [Candidatus Eremiobacteraeota bacterium]